MENLFQRLIYLIEILEKSNQSQFARRIGCPQTTLNGYLNEDGQEKIRVSLLEKILATYPNIARNWLYFGEGTPFVSEEPKDGKELTKRVQALENEVQKLRARILMEGTFAEESGAPIEKAAGQD